MIEHPGGSHAHHRRLKTLAAFGAVYFIWGSNFLAIRYAVESLPPLAMMAVRCAVAGAILYAWGRARGARPARGQWPAAALAGALFFLGCHGLLAWAQRRVPSGMAALLLATIPLWMVLLEWTVLGGPRPTAAVSAGLALGFAGLAVLTGPDPLRGGVDPLGAVVLVLSALSWAAGSLYARSARLPDSTPLATGMQLLAGGALLGLGSLAIGEPGRFDPSTASPRSLVSLAYLIVLGSVVAFTAYVWLLGVTSPARAGTYAFVNPVVAVLLGWAAAGEPLTARVGLATAVIVAAVALITLSRGAARGRRAEGT